MMDNLQIEVQDKELTQFFAGLPNRMAKKPMVTTMRKGAALVNKEIRNSMPGNLKKFKSILGAKTARSATPVLAVGFFGRKVQFINRRGQKWDAWQLVYWHNYGTMANRDASHKFVSSRRQKSANKRGGIRPLRFFDKAVNRALPQAERKIMDEFGNEIDKFAKKYGFR